MIHIVTDSTADFPEGWRERYNVHIVPVAINFGNESYLQDVDLDEDGFYRLIAERGIIPKTSQPPPQRFEEVYTRIAKEGDTIISIHVGSKLSGTYESAVIAAKKLARKIRVIPFDSNAGAAALAFMAREARELADRGAPIQRIIHRLEEIRDSLHIILSVYSLEFAQRSGRIKAIQAALASLLRIKPIVELDNGELIVKSKVRTQLKALQHVVNRMCEEFGNQLVNVAVVAARDPKAMSVLEKEARRALNVNELVRTSLSISVTVHLGPRAAGLVVYPVEAKNARSLAQ